MRPIHITTTLIALSASPSFALDCDEGLRPFTHAAGEDCIPERAERIVALRGDSVATPLLELGAPVIGVGFQTGQDGTKFVRGAIDIFGPAFVDASDLVDVGRDDPPNFEKIATLNPDLIIIRKWQEASLDQFQAIAPTIMVEENVPFLDHLAFLADAVGMSGTYDAQLAEYEARIAEARENIGNPEDIVVSRLDIWEDGMWFYPYWGAVDQVIRDIGFDRPPMQAEATEGMNGVSFELLSEFDGDIIISSTAPRWGQTHDMLVALHDEKAPFWRSLEGVQDGNHYFYERDVWNGNTFKSLHTAIDGLEMLTAGRSFE